MLSGDRDSAFPDSSRSADHTKYRSEYSKPSLAFVLIPTWFSCIIVLTAYLQCMHLPASDPDGNETRGLPEVKHLTEFKSVRRSQVPVFDLNISAVVGSDIGFNHDQLRNVEVQHAMVTPPSSAHLGVEIKHEQGISNVGGPEISFSPSNHGVQVFVHTMLATNIVLKDFDVSWVTQLTADRLDIFSKMLKRWNGPVSATLYCRNLAQDMAAISGLRERVDFHLVLADLHPGRLYPVNTLRNVAIDKCRTNWMILVDADFVPNEGLYEHLLPHLLEWEKGDSAVYVVPAFQLHNGQTKVPKIKAELLEMGSDVSPVHPEPGRDIAHKYTDYPKWRTANEIYDVEYRMPYEPYFVANKRIPRYDTGFLGYGNDKTEHCLEIFKARMKYKVLPQAFVFHVDHPRGEWQKTDQEWIARAPGTLSKFFIEIQEKYNLKVLNQLEPVAGNAGENCTFVCERIDSTKGCRADLARGLNSCETMKKAFSGRCSSCSDAFYGNDLPSYNLEQKSCLLNSKPLEYSTACDVSNAKSERLCPCGAKIPQWLTVNYIISTLREQGGWDSIPSSLSAAAAAGATSPARGSKKKKHKEAKAAGPHGPARPRQQLKKHHPR